ncbi:hypothetical protein Tco_0893395 [Tanacetum coccineum]|uniref:Reverse transcriptase domain-containing protein n=1 Tax=Tanacetum coccineum TaxID=301880 RepID=A0ABQ5CBT1_9ASTR
MSSNTSNYIYRIIVSSDFDVEDAFSSTKLRELYPCFTGLFHQLSQGNPLCHSDDLSKYLLASLAILHFHDASVYEEIFYHLRNEPVSCHSPLLISLPPPQYEIPMSAIEHMEDLDKGLGNDRKRANKAMTDEFVLAHVRTFLNLEILIEDIKEIRKQRNPEKLRVARKCSYKEFMSCQPFNFKGTEGAVGLIRWFERTESIFLRSNYTEDCKVKFATGTLTEEALSWWNSFTPAYLE